MVNICKDKHHEYAVAQSSRFGSMYARGYKKCSMCCVFMKWEGTFCPCCGVRLATKPKGTVSKKAYEKHLTSMSMESIK